MPKALNGFMAFPPIAFIKKINPEKELLAGLGIRFVQVRQDRSTGIVRLIGMTLRRPSGMRSLAGHMAVGRQGFIGVSGWLERKQGLVLSGWGHTTIESIPTSTKFVRHYEFGI